MKLLRAEARQVCFAPIDLKDVTVVIIDGFKNGDESPTVAGAESTSSTEIEITDGTMEKSVPVGSFVKFAGDNQKYAVTAASLNASGTDEVQSLSASGASSGTFTLTFNTPDSQSFTTAAIAYDAAPAAIQTAVDTAFSGQSIDGVNYQPGDITVGGAGTAEAAATTFTYDGASVGPRNWALATVDGTGLTGGGSEAITQTTQGEKAGSTNSITISPGLLIALSGTEAMTFSGVEVEVTVGEGNLTYDENREVEFILDRGQIDQVKLGDEQPMDVNMDFTWEFLKSVAGATVPTVEEALKQEGPASTWVTAATGECDPYCVDIELRNEPTCGGVQTEFIRLPCFYWTQISHDPDASQVSVTGQCNALLAVKTRQAAS